MEQNPSTWREFIAHIGKLLKGDVLNGSHNITLVTADSHPSFYESIADVGRRMGVPMPHIVVSDSFRDGLVWAQKAPNAAAVPGRKLMLINHGMLDVSGSNLNQRISPGLETIVAHEFSHLKDGAGLLKVASKIPHIAPIAAMTGLFLYENAKRNVPRDAHQTDKQFAKQLHDQIQVEAAKEVDRLDNEKPPSEGWHIDPAWQKRMVEAGRYLATAALGWAGGLLVTRHISLSAEYRADRLAIEATHAPEAFKKIFTESRRRIDEFVDFSQATPKNAKEFFRMVRDEIESFSIAAHPSLKERFRYVDKVAREIGIPTQAR